MAYNGHKNWNHWNVSLWISNDEGLYNICRRHKRMARTLDVAAERIVAELAEMRVTKTPDGAPYTKTSVRAAISDL